MHNCNNYMEKLDLFDFKLLHELDKNSSITAADLAHKIGRSKQFVLYRLNKLQEKVISGYYAIVDMSKLGYFTFRIYFKFQQMTSEDGENFIKYVRDSFTQVWTITSMHGKWDYALFLGVKSVTELHNIWDLIMLNYKNKIKSYNVSLYAPIHNFNRKFLYKKETNFVERIYGIGTPENIDRIDEELLKIYASNVRISSIDIGKRLNISSDTVRRRIKNLEKRKIIVGYRIGLNLKSLGLTSYRVDLQLISTKRNKELIQYCRQHKYIYQVNKTIGGADFEMELVAYDFNHLLELINDIKLKFSDVINDVEHFEFTTFHVLKYIPD